MTLRLFDDVAPRFADRPGGYSILFALTVDDNRTDLPVKVVPWTR